MQELFLNIATLLGGLSALWFFFERLLPTDGAEQALREKDTAARRGFWATLRAPTLPMPVVLGAQWIVSVFVLFATSTLTGVFAFYSPLWIIPLSYMVTRFVTRQSGLARIVGGLAGGMIGAGIAWGIRDWATRYGLVYGVFFGALVSGHLATPKRQVTVFSAFTSTLLLLAGLKVFEEGDFFLDPPGAAFVAGALAAVTWIICMALADLRRQSRRKPRQPRARVTAAGGSATEEREVNSDSTSAG